MIVKESICKQFVFPNGPPIGDIYVKNDPGNNFDHLLYRTNENGPLITLITLSEDMEIYTKVLWPSNTKTFIGSHISKQGDIYLTGMAGDKLITEQFNRDGELLNKLQIELDVRNNSYFTAIMRADSFANKSILVAIQYMNANKYKSISLYNFNFDAGRITGAPPVLLDKTYHDALDAKEPGSKRHLTPISDLVPADILTTQTQVILVNEVRLINLNNILNKAAVVLFFNKELQPLHETVLNKTFINESGLDAQLKCFLHSEKLFVLSSETGSISNPGEFCYIIDVTTGKKEKRKLHMENILGTINLAATILFKNSFVVGILKKETISENARMTLLPIKYEDVNKLPMATR